MADQFTKNCSSSRSSSVIRNSSCRSVKKSLSPPLLNSQAQVPPCIWDVEYPRQSINQPLRRSFSERSRPSKIFKPSASSSVVRSLWNAENKEYLEMRFGLLMRKEQGGESCCSSSSSSTFFDSSSISPGKPMIQQQQQQQDLDASASSEEASSIFSHPDCSSFSSGSDDLSSVRDEPAIAEEEQRKQEARKEDDEEAFLDYALEQGNLVDNPRAVTRTNDHPAKRHNVVSLHALEESPRRKLYSPSPPKRSIRPSFANDDRYPMLPNSGRHLMRSYTAKPTMKLLDSAVDQEPKAPVARRLISGTDHQQQQFSPGRFSKPKISEEVIDESASTGIPQSQPLNQSVSLQPAQAQDQDEEPEVHCKLFFHKRFIRHRKRGKDSPTIRASDGYQTAHLHCAVRHDHHSYTFVVDGCEDLLLVARAPRIKCDDGKDEEVEICSFYSWKQRRRPKVTRSLSWKKPAWAISSAAAASESKPESSEILARMKLSRRFSRGQHAAVDLEYVMFDATTERGQQQQQQQLGFQDDARLSFSSWEARDRKSSPQSSSAATSSASSVLVNQNSKRSWWSLVPGSPVLRRKSSKNLSSPSRGKIDEDVDVLTEIWKQMEAAESLRRAQAARKLQELAAFVVTVPSRKNHHQLHQEISPQHARNNSFDCLPEPREIKNSSSSSSSSALDVTVVLPIGDHGMPSGSDAGPSPLIKRWRTGSCDCGGWDVGCALNVLRRDPEESQSNLLEISLQGAAKHDKDVFSLVGLSNGLFSIRFKEPLSALQAFGAAVAILYRNPNNNAVTSSCVNRDLEMNVNAAQEWSKGLGLPCSASGVRSQQFMHLERL